jgi:hypothetical protein
MTSWLAVHREGKNPAAHGLRTGKKLDNVLAMRLISVFFFAPFQDRLAIPAALNRTLP